VAFNTCCGIQYLLWHSIPAVVFNTCCGIQYLLWYSIPAVAFNTCCGIQYLLRYSIPAAVFNTCCGIQYLLWYSIPAVAFNTCCGIQYLLWYSPAVVWVLVEQISVHWTVLADSHTQARKSEIDQASCRLESTIRLSHLSPCKRAVSQQLFQKHNQSWACASLHKSRQLVVTSTCEAVGAALVRLQLA
jgi:hypothetical protein